MKGLPAEFQSTNALFFQAATCLHLSDVAEIKLQNRSAALLKDTSVDYDYKKDEP